ncbi:MAG: M48 family metalloprotease [Deltaproteobacteria bacterium]|nr:M48 family metalloprotease [Deltaproteobacteria bacterium]
MSQAKPQVEARRGSLFTLVTCVTRVTCVTGVTGLLLALSLVAAGCGGGGQPQRKQTVLATDFDDAKVGEESARGMAAEMGIVDDPVLTRYVEKIGMRMVPFAPIRPFVYKFHVVDQSAPNAFALPGGYIYISRGLLTLVNSEDELACVVGHEITHAAERHAAGRQEYMRRMNPLAMGYLRYGQIQAYGREHERDADRGGQIIASRAGYDPMGMAKFMQDLDAMTRLELGWSRLPSFFDSHPSSPERAATAAQRAQSLSWIPQPHVARTQEDFLHKLEGLVLGNDPKEGVFRGETFLHPDMNFALRFPDGWQLVNSRRAVGAIEPHGDAMISMTVAGPGDDPEAAAQLFIHGELRQARGQVTRAQSIRVGDYEAYRIEIEVGAVKTGGHLTFLAHEGMIYRIDTISRAGKVSQFEGRGRAVVRSFRGLTPEERESFKIVTLGLAKAMEGEPLAALSARSGNALDLGTTAVLNDMHIDTRLREGQLVKIGVATPYVPEAATPPEPHDVDKRSSQGGV